MNKLNRLTALLMALMMIFTTFASAESVYQPGAMTQDDWDALIKQTQDSLMTEEFGVALPVKSADNTNYNGTPDGKQYASQTEANITETAAATLYKSGVLTLTGTDGRWQINVGGDIWVNIGNEQGTTLTVTEAMLNGASKVRQLHADGTSHEVAITVTEAPAAEPAMLLNVQSKEAVPEEEITEEVQEQLTNPEGGAPMTVQDVNPTTFTVVINYVFTDGAQAASPYTGTVAAGSDLKTTVNSPTVLGYTPDQPSIEFDETNIQADITKTVIYSPALVTFTVKHYQQNLNDDNYAEPPVEETKTGYTESAVGETLAKEYEGFYALLYDTTTAIAADGSTVVEIYYDRYYYLMNFDLDGGYGVEPIYARYGTPIEVGTPTRAGYSFEKWQKGGVDATPPATMPAENQTYKAVWDPDETATVTVVFWGENPNDEEYSYDHTGTVQIKPGTEFTFTEGTQFVICGNVEHSHSEDCAQTVTCGKTEHTHNSECCTSTAGHTHTTACFAGVGSESSTGSIGKPDNPQNGQVYRGYLGTYIYINGTWYDYTGSTSSGNVAPAICGKTAGTHYHDEGTCTCNQEAHTHDASCSTYSCGLSEHTHISSCYQTGAGMSSTQWKLVKSDTVTVAADGTSIINVYYDRVEYMVQFYTRGNSPTEYENLRITAKWGAQILDKWPTYNGSSSWYVASSGNTWQNSIQVMPVGGAKFYGPKTGSDTYTAYYYVEVLPGESGTVHNGVTYKLHHSDISSSSGSVTDEERYEIEGFTYKEGTANGQSFNNAKFYYTRNSYNLEYISSGSKLEDKTASVKYEEPLTNYNITPPYPSNLEPNAYQFGGWYDDQYFQQPVNWNSTMPASDKVVYAHWVPVTHTVTFALDKDAQPGLYPAQTVPHGSKITPVDKPENGSYTFIGWFYMDNGVEKAFDLNNMPVNRDLNLYAKWSSNKLMEYTIRYALDDNNDGVADTNANGDIIYIADAETGSGLAGSTKTFDAKAGNELYDLSATGGTDYTSGFFPVTNSHSMNFNIEDGNEFTFLYVPKTEVPYIVRYLEKDTEVVLHEEKHVSTRDAIVTETFVAITGYMPDAYQKRLVLSANEEENVIIFWYVKDDTHAPLHIVHYTQNIEGEDYTVYQESTDINALIGTTYSEDSLTIPGFVYNEENSRSSGTMTAEGLELKLYYDRIEYPYEFKFLEQGTDKVLAEPVTGTARYQAQVTQNFKGIEGYHLVNASPQVIQIAIEDPANVASKNVRIFYYQENDVTLNYEVVGPEGCGTVSPASEPVKAVTGTALGSTATASSNAYKFVGWYLDEACTQPVPAENVDANNKFVPTKADGTLWVDKTTYYAKLEYNLTNLTITKAGSNETLDPNQSFIFTVSGGDLTDPLTVVIVNNGSVTISGLTVGVEYTVTEDTGWSWRYAPDAAEKKITLKPISNTLTFTNTRDEIYWLDGNATSGPNDFN